MIIILQYLSIRSSLFYPVPRRGVWADISQRRGSCCQLCPSLLHPGCQLGLPSLSWSLLHCAVHLSAWLLGRVHPQPGSQETQVGSPPLSLPCYVDISSFWYCEWMLVRDNNGRTCLFQEGGEKPGEAGKSHSRGQFIELKSLFHQSERSFSIRIYRMWKHN